MGNEKSAEGKSVMSDGKSVPSREAMDVMNLILENADRPMTVVRPALVKISDSVYFEVDAILSFGKEGTTHLYEGIQDKSDERFRILKDHNRELLVDEWVLTDKLKRFAENGMRLTELIK